MGLSRWLATFVLVATLIIGLTPAAAFAQEDTDIPGGHFFTQTGGGGGLGYSVTDEAGVPFWSEFNRLGGVQGVGYPASQRFMWNGFVCQVFQRVVFQWNPQTGRVDFVNVFDLFTQMGKDPTVLETRQVPPPKQWSEAGLSWEQIVAGRTAVLDAFPAIKAAYYGAVGDPIQANGLPTSDVVDMGNHFHLRAQRVSFQLWKENVPWASAGHVTISLGGDLAKELGILPDPSALLPHTADGATAPVQPTPPPSSEWKLHQDQWQTFEVPAGWFYDPMEDGGGAYTNADPNSSLTEAFVLHFGTPNPIGDGVNLRQFVDGYFPLFFLVFGEGSNPVILQTEERVINGLPAVLIWFEVSIGDHRSRFLNAFYQKGVNVQQLVGGTPVETWTKYEPIFLHSISSFQAR